MGKFKVKTDKQTYNQVRSLLLESGFHISAPTGKDWVIGELGGVISSYSNWNNNPPDWFYDIKEITLAELRAMVKPMKEYLNKETYAYVKTHDLVSKDSNWIEIPEGAEVATKNGETIFFWKPSQNSTYVDDEGWVLTIKGMISFEEYSRNPYCRIVWEKNIGVLRMDNVNNPGHYTQGKVECIDALESATIGKSGIEAVCVANVIKYLWRYEEKNGLEDVKKAQWYLERLIASMDS